MPLILTAGSLVMDLVARAPRHPQPGETIRGASLARYPGGKGANQAIAVARMGLDSLMIGKTGEDNYGREIVDYLAECGVDTSCVLRSPRSMTGTSLVVVSENGENTIVMVPGANAEFSAHDLDLEHVEKQRAKVVIAQLEIPAHTIETLFIRNRGSKCRTILNAAPAVECPDTLFNLSDIVIMNEIEAAFFLQVDVPTLVRNGGLKQVLNTWRRDTEQSVVITLGAEGVYALHGMEEYRLTAYPVPVRDTVGAGDCFVGVFAAILAEDGSFAQSLKTANAAAALAVQRNGAAPGLPWRNEVDELLHS